MSGVLACQEIADLIERGRIASEPDIIPAQIQPASLDLRLGNTAWRVRASFLAGKDAKVEQRLADFEMHKIDLSSGYVLEKGCVYVVPLIDRVPAGYQGQLYAEICPRSFSVLVRPGMRLNQIRFRSGQAILSDSELLELHQAETLVNGPAIIDDGLGFSVDLKPRQGSLVGYRAKPHTGVIDLEQIGAYEPADFWEELHSRNGQIILDPGAFYILVSQEAVHIPPDYAAEMAPFLAMVGEFRVHYAGFFDPGFGHDAAGGGGSRGVLEVRCHEAPFVLEHGQIVGRLIYERMRARPSQIYGAGIASNYQGQGLKLSKHFKAA